MFQCHIGPDLLLRAGAPHLQGAQEAAHQAADRVRGARDHGRPPAGRPGDCRHHLGRPRLALARLRALGAGEHPASRQVFRLLEQKIDFFCIKRLSLSIHFIAKVTDLLINFYLKEDASWSTITARCPWTTTTWWAACCCSGRPWCTASWTTSSSRCRG